MLIALIGLASTGVAWIALTYWRDGLRLSFARAFVGMLTLVVLWSELLSAAGLLTRGPVALAWCGTTLLSIGALAEATRAGRAPWAPGDWAARLRRAFREDRVSSGVILLVAAITLVIALWAPPNTYDSMTYHMSRVSAWIQQGSLDHFATGIERQNTQQPLAELAILHLQLLSGSDRFANLVQWMAFILSTVLVSLVVQEMEGSRRSQWRSGLLVVTLPMAILQSSGTQTDLVAGALCLAFVLFLMRAVRLGRTDDWLLCGLALGLALLTKGTSYIFAAPFGAWLGARALLHGEGRARRRALALGGLALLIGLLLNAAFLQRNASLYGNPFGERVSRHRNAEISARVVVANGVRHAALNFTTPIGPAQRALDWAMDGVLEVVGEPEGSSWPGTRFEVDHHPDEDRASNPLHFVMIVLACAALPFAPRHLRRSTLPYALSLLAAALLYCLLLRWQPWATRLQLPLFLLGLPLVALALEQKVRALAWGMIVVVLLAGSARVLLSNPSRPLVPHKGRSLVTTSRTSLYFARASKLEDPFVTAATLLRDSGANEIGLVIGRNEWEYPLWVLLGNEATRRPPVLRHVAVGNRSSTYEPKGALPSLIFANVEVLPESLIARGYEVTWRSGDVRILERSPALAPGGITRSSPSAALRAAEAEGAAEPGEWTRTGRGRATLEGSAADAGAGASKGLNADTSWAKKPTSG